MQREDTQKNQADIFLNKNGLALIFFKKGDIIQAQNLLEEGEKILRNIPTKYIKLYSPMLYHNLFHCFIFKKDYDNAVNIMNNLLIIDPNPFMCYESLALMYMDIDEIEKAEETLLKAIDIDPEYFQFYFLLGKVKYLSEDYQSAIEYFLKACELNPLDIASLCYLTTIYNFNEDYKLVAKLLENFDFKLCNNNTGELIFNNRLISLINLKSDKNYVENLICEAKKICPSSSIINQIEQEFRKIYA